MLWNTANINNWLLLLVYWRFTNQLTLHAHCGVTCLFFTFDWLQVFSAKVTATLKVAFKHLFREERLAPGGNRNKEQAGHFADVSAAGINVLAQI